MNIFVANISHFFAKKLKATLLTLLLLISASLLSAHADVNDIRRRAENGEPHAQFVYGFLYQSGSDGLPKNANEAIKWYRKAADQGHGKAAFAIGILYRDGEGVARNIPLAMYWYKKAFENGDSDGIDAYNELYNMGYRAATSPYGKSPDTTPIPEIVSSSPANNSGSSITDPIDQFNKGVEYEKSKNYTEAVKWFRKAAEQGIAEAQYNLGVFYANGQGVTQNYTEAVKWYSKAAEQGDAMAQHNLGVCYANGQGVQQNYAEAVKWYRKAAEQGLAKAQSNLGVCYDNGQGVTQNYTEAVKWYRKAAEQGNAPAQSNLGICYYNGQGVTQNYTEAVKWYRKAAEQGIAQAQSNLGLCYANGQGVTQNYSEAVNWWRKAAEQGIAEAQYNLGVCYKSGTGVTKNIPVAMFWYKKAADNGLTNAREAYNDLYNQGYRAATSPNDGTGSSNKSTGKSTAKTSANTTGETTVESTGKNPRKATSWPSSGNLTAFTFANHPFGFMPQEPMSLSQVSEYLRHANWPSDIYDNSLICIISCSTFKIPFKMYGKDVTIMSMYMSNGFNKYDLEVSDYKSNWTKNDAIAFAERMYNELIENGFRMTDAKFKSSINYYNKAVTNGKLYIEISSSECSLLNTLDAFRVYMTVYLSE